MEAALRRPYSDPTLMSKPSVYGGFLRGCSVRGLIRYRRYVKGSAALGVFFVIKKDGVSLRIIFDTRLLNCDFFPPPRTSLATASAVGKIETSPGSDTFVATAEPVDTVTST